MKNHKDDDDDDLLTFSLSCNPSKRPRHSPPPNPPPQTTHTQIPLPNTMFVPYPTASNPNIDAAVNNNVPANAPSAAVSRSCRPRSQGKSETIHPPYPWARNRRATVHSHRYLLENKIVEIKGSVECKSCKKEFEMVLQLEPEFSKLWNFFQREEERMHDRAPKAWMKPVLPNCQYCGQENCVYPYLTGTKKKDINWLFLLLGQMIGCLKLIHLRYFLKHTNIHRTGAKDRNVYSTYITLFKQLLPDHQRFR